MVLTEQPLHEPQAKPIHSSLMNSVGPMPDGKLLFQQNTGNWGTLTCEDIVNKTSIKTFINHKALCPDHRSASRTTCRNSHIDSKVTVVRKKMCYGCVKHQAVTVHDGSGDPVMDGPGRGLPRQSPPVPIQLQSVGKVLGLLAGTNEQNNGKELLVAFVLLLLLQYQHEVVAETRLHHHPVDGPRQVNVRS